MNIPKRTPLDVVSKCQKVATQINSGVSYTQLKGKRLFAKHQDGRIRISVPIGYRHRLICLFNGSVTEPYELITHEDYNTKYNKVG